MHKTLQIARRSDLAHVDGTDVSARVGLHKLVLYVTIAVALVASGAVVAPASADDSGTRRYSEINQPNVVYPLVGAAALRMTPYTVPTDPSLAATPTPAAEVAPAAVAAASGTPTDSASATPSASPSPSDSASPSQAPSSAAPTTAAPTTAAATADPTKPGDGIVVASRCGSSVVAATPGKVDIINNVPWAGGRLVRVVTEGSDGLTTSYGHLRNITVTDGQVVLSGDQLGRSGVKGTDSSCVVGKPGALYFDVETTTANNVDSRSWMASHAGKPIPSGDLFGNAGFNLATFNIQGYSHRRGNYKTRFKKTIALFNKNKVDVVGTQEFQRPQRALFMQSARKTYAIYPFSADSDPDNSIMWRSKTFDFVDGGTFGVPYFRGNIRKMPWVLLRFKEGGRYPAMAGKQAYFLNVHNPATIRQYHDSARWRAKAIAVEIKMVNKLAATGTPVFLTGDFNDKSKAFCPLTTKADMASPLGGSDGATCQYPRARTGIDWIFVAGDATFSRYEVDYGVNGPVSDHPFYLSRAHLAD